MNEKLPPSDKRPEPANELLQVTGKLMVRLQYGENPYQQDAALFETDSTDPLAITKFQQIEGSDLSFNNYADVDRLLQSITHAAANFAHNYSDNPMLALGAKHGNLCGAASSASPQSAIKDMLEGDLRAIFGGAIMVNFPVGENEAELLARYKQDGGKRLLDVLAAPYISNPAQELLKRKGGKLRMLVNSALSDLDETSIDTAQRVRYVRGGILSQQNYTFVPGNEDITFIENTFNEAIHRDMLLAHAIGSTSNSNTITIVKDGKLLGNGVGQQDRVIAAELAIKRAQDSGHSLEGSIAYSDSFFPFPDAPMKLVEAGVSAILTSSGSVNDSLVLETLRASGVIVATVPDKTGRGFYAH
jgi:phosphoribosylaminoimidazolecarboxamide formyltransferase/IMP cyclohydrolase